MEDMQSIILRYIVMDPQGPILEGLLLKGKQLIPYVPFTIAGGH
jgi:hypothetical protein